MSSQLSLLQLQPGIKIVLIGKREQLEKKNRVQSFGVR